MLRIVWKAVLVGPLSNFSVKTEEHINKYEDHCKVKSVNSINQ